jgi:hypothetical protein
MDLGAMTMVTAAPAASSAAHRTRGDALMDTSEVPGGLNHDRRRFLGTAGAAALAVGATQLGLIGSAKAQASMAFGPVRQVNAGVLNVGYVDAGPADGRPVVLLHGFPYDIHSFVEVAPSLAARGSSRQSPTCTTPSARRTTR